MTSAVGYLGWTHRYITGSPPSASFILRPAVIGFALGVGWEIAEALVLNLAWIDTILDLLMDTIGAVAAGWFVGWSLMRLSPN